jgi:hypothetical protein
MSVVSRVMRPQDRPLTSRGRSSLISDDNHLDSHPQGAKTRRPSFAGTGPTVPARFPTLLAVWKRFSESFTASTPPMISPIWPPYSPICWYCRWLLSRPDFQGDLYHPPVRFPADALAASGVLGPLQVARGALPCPEDLLPISCRRPHDVTSWYRSHVECPCCLDGCGHAEESCDGRCRAPTVRPKGNPP